MSGTASAEAAEAAAAWESFIVCLCLFVVYVVLLQKEKE